MRITKEVFVFTAAMENSSKLSMWGVFKIHQKRLKNPGEEKLKNAYKKGFSFYVKMEEKKFPPKLVTYCS
jgi:hypothetical protein